MHEAKSRKQPGKKRKKITIRLKGRSFTKKSRKTKPSEVSEPIPRKCSQMDEGTAPLTSSRASEALQLIARRGGMRRARKRALTAGLLGSGRRKGGSGRSKAEPGSEPPSLACFSSSRLVLLAPYFSPAKCLSVSSHLFLRWLSRKK